MSSATRGLPCDHDCWPTGLSWLKVLAVNLSQPADWHGSYASLNPRRLKGEKRDWLLRNLLLLQEGLAPSPDPPTFTIWSTPNAFPYSLGEKVTACLCWTRHWPHHPASLWPACRSSLVSRGLRTTTRQRTSWQLQRTQQPAPAVRGWSPPASAAGAATPATAGRHAGSIAATRAAMATAVSETERRKSAAVLAGPVADTNRVHFTRTKYNDKTNWWKWYNNTGCLLHVAIFMWMLTTCVLYS